MKKIYTILFTIQLSETDRGSTTEKVLAESNSDAERIIRNCYVDYKDDQIQFSDYNPLQVEDVEDILKKNGIIVE